MDDGEYCDGMWVIYRYCKYLSLLLTHFVVSIFLFAFIDIYLRSRTLTKKDRQTERQRVTVLGRLSLHKHVCASLLPGCPNQSFFPRAKFASVISHLKYIKTGFKK